MKQNRITVIKSHSNDFNSTGNTRKLCLFGKNRNLLRDILFTTVTILIAIAIIILVVVLKNKNKTTKSVIKTDTTTRTTIMATELLTKVKITTTITVGKTLPNLIKTTATITSASLINPTTTIFPLGVNFDSAIRRFLFTMTNQSPHPFILIKSDRWYGHIDDSVRKLEPGNDTYTSVLQIRGVRSNDFGTGVTYALCFRMHDTDGYATNIRLNIYLQVAFFGSNYFGWTFYDGSDCDPAEQWYNKKQYDRMKKNCADPVLNKGGTLRLTASCYNMKIEMLTDNNALSTPRMMIETEKIKKD